MGVITVKIPQKIKRTYSIDSEKKARELIDSLDEIEPNGRLRDLSDIVGLWADRNESAEEISNELRKRSHGRYGL